MTERERLIEFIEKADETVIGFSIDGDIGILADHLLASGVIVPPCKVGDRVWFVHYNRGEVCEATIVSVEYNYYTSPQEWITVEYISPYSTAKNNYKTRIDLMFGKCVFFTREEAEKALKEKNNE